MNIPNPDEAASHSLPNVGMLALRYTVGGQRRLTQQALIEANDQVYYVFSFTSPGAKFRQDDPEAQGQEDPKERQAVECVWPDHRYGEDSGPGSPSRADQNERLYRTRTLFVNLHNANRLKERLIPEQWLRLIRDGKDIGYTYVVEEVEQRPGSGTPRKGVAEGVLVSLRARTIPESGTQVDVSSQMFVTFDWKHENWTRTS